MTDEPWSATVRLSEVGRVGPIAFAPDEATRAKIAKALDLQALPEFAGEARVSPWLDGAEIAGRWRARVTYRCGVTLEPFDAALEGEFTIRAVPEGSALAQPASGEIELDPDAEDPPDVLDGERIDVGAYMVEHLALELDPFPRKPGAVFENPTPSAPESPFAVLHRLQRDDPQS